jgi:O-glycosyl hydrolase
MNKRMKKIFNASLITLTFIAMISLALPASANYSAVVDPAIQYQTVEGWGTSLAWWANVTGGFANKDDYADKIFGSSGLQLNVVRYNIGGGDPNDTYMQFRAKVPGFEPSNGTWNWNADANQRYILSAAKARGANVFEAFSNSPPVWMTNSGSVTGASGGGNNLKSGYEDDFANYLTEVVKHFHDSWGITFRTLNPMNEPISSWWKLGNNQEGDHFDLAGQNTIIKQVASTLTSKGMTYTTVSSPDENSIDNSVTSFNSYDSTAKSNISQINTHSYNGSNRSGLLNTAKSNGKRLWQSEYGDGDATGITMSKKILSDMKDMQPSAWVYWQAVENSTGWGFLNNVLDGSGNTSYTYNQKYYVMGNYSKFIRPGYKMISINDGNSLAAYDSSSGKLVIVTTNNGTADTNVTYDLTRFGTVSGPAVPYRTGAGASLGQQSNISVSNKSFTATAKAGSVTTYVITGVSGISSGGIVSGGTYTLLNPNSGKVLDVTANGTADGTNVEIWQDGGATNQRWILTDNGDGTYKVIDSHSGKALDVSGTGTADGTNVDIWPYNSGSNQKWKITQNTDGTYKFIDSHSGKALDVTGNGTANGTNVEIWTDNGGSSQKWTLTLH